MLNTHNKTSSSRSSASLVEVAACYAERGVIHAEGGRWDNALIWFERAASYDPDNAHYLLLFAQSCENANRLPEAITAADDAIVLLTSQHAIGTPRTQRPNAAHQASASGQTPPQANASSSIPALLAIIGRCCLRLGDYNGAIRAWTILLDHAPDNTEAWLGLLDGGRALTRAHDPF